MTLASNFGKISAAQLVLSSFSQMLQLSLEEVDKIGVEVPIPQFLEETVDNLLEEALVLSQVFGESALLDLDANIVVVGDIHGNLVDLIRILIINGLPPASKYLFLGDYVDRGSFSTECICLILALCVTYPKNVFCLRGNHELPEVNKVYGFYDEIMHIYNNDHLWNKFNEYFEYLPLAAIVNKEYFCVHGGITKNLTIPYIRALQLPIHNISSTISDMLWSDPNDEIQAYKTNIRGCGIEFGFIFCANFLEANQLKGIIRGHQCIKEGVKLSPSMNVVTVFSSSSYSQDKTKPNNCGYLLIDPKGVNKRIIPQVDMIPRCTAYFYTVRPEMEKTKLTRQRPLITLSCSSPHFFLGSPGSLKGPLRPMQVSSTLIQKRAVLPAQRRSSITPKVVPIFNIHT